MVQMVDPKHSYDSRTLSEGGGGSHRLQLSHNWVCSRPAYVLWHHNCTTTEIGKILVKVYQNVDILLKLELY